MKPRLLLPSFSKSTATRPLWQHAGVAVAAATLVVGLLPRPGLPVVVAAEEGPLGARGIYAGTGVQEQARLAAGRPGVAYDGPLAGRIGQIVRVPRLLRVLRAALGDDRQRALLLPRTAVEQQRAVQQLRALRLAPVTAAPAAALPRLAVVVTVDD